MPVRRWGLNQVVKRRPSRGINGDQRRGAYIFTAFDCRLDRCCVSGEVVAAVK